MEQPLMNRDGLTQKQYLDALEAELQRIGHTTFPYNPAAAKQAWENNTPPEDYAKFLNEMWSNVD